MNIVTATFSAGCSEIEADRKLWQYDQGQVLQLVGLDLPDAYQVEFSNSRDKGSAKAQIGGPDGVSIPDEYLTTGKPVYAFLVGHTAEEDRETERLVVIYVNARSQPTDEPITPEQQNIVDQLIAALTAGVAKAENAAEQAEAAISYMPKIVQGTWWVYDAEAETWTDTGIQAEGQDGVGISGAVLNADYTLTLTFTDATSYTTPPIRGPKGEDAPTDYILVQPTQPTSPTNRLWVDSDRGSTVQLPTMADHQALAEAVAANTEAIGDLSDEIADQKSVIEDNKLTLDFSQSRNGYRISNTVIAGAITYASSSATNVYDRVCKVRKNANYRLRTISQSINTDGARVSAIVDGGSVVRQIVYPIYGTDSTKDIYFTACVDGFLSIGAASGNVEIELYENAYPDNTYVIPITVDDTFSGSYGIDAGKLKYSSSARRRCGFLNVPPCKYFSLVPLNGYRISTHKVDIENNASWVNGNLSSPSFVLPKETANYTVIVSNYDTTTNVVIPQDGIFGYLYTWSDQPFPEYCPVYSPDKIAQVCKIIEFSGHVQGCATDGTNILICNPNGRMALYGIKSKEAVLIKSFEADAYGHMNSATYYDGKYYVASMKSTGEIYVFDSTTLELVNTIIAKNGANEVINPWAICFDKINNKFYLENSNGLMIYDAAFVFQQRISWPDIQYEKTHVGQGCVCDENTYYSIASYATTSSAYWFIARDFDGTYKTTIKFVTNGLLEIEDGAYDYNTGMMYVTAMDNNANKSYVFAVNVKSQPNITMLLA